MQRILPQRHFSAQLSNSSTSTATFSPPPEGADFSQSIFPSRSVNHCECSARTETLPAGILKQQGAVGSDLMLKLYPSFVQVPLITPQ